MGIESTTEGAITKIENDVKLVRAGAENVITNEARALESDATRGARDLFDMKALAHIEAAVRAASVTMKKDVTGYVTTFEQDARSFEVASRGALVRFFAKIFRF